MDLDERLSANFTLREFVKSQTAARKGIDNRPPAEAVDALRRLCAAVLQPAREALGPIIVTSGFRCEALNAAIGGSAQSQHCRGEVVDIEALSSEISNHALAEWIKAHCPYDQLILECYSRGEPKSGWVHVSYVEPTPRRMALTYTGGAYLQGLLA